MTADLESISLKIDSMAAQHAMMIVFAPDEIERIRASVKFTTAFHNDPTTLNRMADIFGAVEGTMRVGKWVLIFIGVVVVGMTQLDRLREMTTAFFVGGKP